MIMTNREEEFYKNLIISDEDKIRAEKSLKSKGVEKHILIKERLLNWCTSDSIEYEKIASTCRYDKRIRAVLFKYISYFEEFYRSVIHNNFSYQTKQKFWNKSVMLNIKKHNNLNDALQYLGFYELLKQCQKLPAKTRDACLFVHEHLTKNIYALKELRNVVMHNKFLLLYRGYEKCFINGVDNGRSASLKANILNLIQFLPKDVGNQCARDINDCKRNRNKKVI